MLAMAVGSGIVVGLAVLFIGSALFPPIASVSLTRLPQGMTVSQVIGFRVSGSYSHLGNSTIWLTDYSGGYVVDDQATLYSNGTWTAADSELGDPGQKLPFSLTVRVLVADPECARTLTAAMNGSGGDYLTALPGGCTVAASATVDVTTR